MDRRLPDFQLPGGGVDDRAPLDDVERALDAGEIGAWEWDLATGGMRWSAQMFRNLGVDAAEARADLYQCLLQAAHPSERAAASRAFEEFRTRLGPIRVEVRVVWPGDEPHWVVFLGKTTAGPDGVPAQMSGITIDSTRRRKSQEASAAALAETEQRLRELNRKLQQRAERRGRQLGASRAQMQAIFDNSPDWLTLFRATVDGRFIYEDMNRATERAYGLGYDQVVGRTVEDVLGVEQAQLPLRLMRECIRTGENQRYTARRTMAGVTRTVDVMFVRVPEQLDGDYHIMATARDTTERDEMEERLRQAQKMEAVGQLTGGLAHDFNNLLTTVLGNIELLGPHIAGNALAQRYLAAAQRGAENGAKLTEQLLAFSRRQHLQPRAADLNAIVEGMHELLTRTIGPSIQIDARLAPGLWPALIDPTQIEVAILNLALNSRDAMPQGGILTIATRNLVPGDPLPAELSGKDCVAITVCDTGVGMSEEVARAAIEPFFTTKETGKGSGLGLSQVYGVVQQSNGAMRIDSRPGEGTAIHLFLPRTAASEPAAAVAPEVPREERAGARILVVDDDEEVRLVTQQMLDDFGYSVVAVASGNEALQELAAGETVDLMVIDVVMPGLSGVETVRQARAAHPGLKALYVTGYADLYGSRSTGDEPLIKKPFRISELIEAVDGALAREPSRPKEERTTLTQG